MGKVWEITHSISLLQIKESTPKLAVYNLDEVCTTQAALLSKISSASFSIVLSSSLHDGTLSIRPITGLQDHTPASTSPEHIILAISVGMYRVVSVELTDVVHLLAAGTGHKL